MLKDWIANNAIALAAGLYLFVALSGVSMYFSFYPMGIWWSHQWMGLALAGVSALLARHYWAAARVLLPRVALFGAVAIVLGAGIRLATPRSPRPEPKNSTHQILGALTHASIVEIAPVFHNDPDAIVARLRDLGFTVASSQQSLNEIARTSGRNEREALGALTELLWKK